MRDTSHHLTFLDPKTLEALTGFVESTVQDANGNGDNITLALASWVSLLGDCPGKTKPERVIRKFFNRIKRDPEGTMAKGAELSKKLQSSVSYNEDGSCSKISLHKEFGRWPIFREYKRWYDTDDDSIWQFLLTFLNYGRKAEYIDPGLNEASIQRWREIESDLCRIDPPHHLLDDLKFILSHLPDPDINDLSLKFGQKHVAEPEVEVYSHKLDMRYHPCVDAILDHIAGDAPGLDVLIPNVELWELGKTDKQQASIDYSRRRDVPKDRWSVRGIGMEPNTLMYTQQGVLAMLLAAIKRSPFTRIIKIEDQTRNADLAVRSSKDGRFDTIDMKDASDRESNRVVRWIFPAKWNEFFQSTRTARAKLPNGRFVRVEKFAPMGSALCFPVQTLTFTAVCCLARFIVSEGMTAEQYLKRDALLVHELRANWETAVYGDDIICPRSDTLVVISLLETLGFKVNTSKSYLHPCAFRESCGRWAIRGTIVDPILFKVKGLAAQSLEYVYGIIDLCNRLYVAGYRSAHAFLARYLPGMFYVEVPFDGVLPVMPYELLSDDPNNSYLKQRRLAGVYTEGGPTTTNVLWQRDEVRIKEFRVNVDAVRGEFHDRYQYACFLQSPSTTEGNKPPKGDTVQPVVRGVWVAVR